MASDGRKKLTFDGFLMNLVDDGVKDSEGVFTVASRSTVEKLREQYSGDLGLGYTELLQGFQELGADRVEISSFSRSHLAFSARFTTNQPDLTEVLQHPLSILSATNCLQSGTGLVLLQHEEDQLIWSVGDGREFQDWQFSLEDGCFEPSRELIRRPRLKGLRTGATWLQFQLWAKGPLAIFTRDSQLSWEGTRLSRDFTNRLAFYGCPLTYRGKNLQCPLPGRLVPTDYWVRSPIGGMGYNWIPLAFHYVAAKSESSHYFCSEPFTGVIGKKVEVNGRLMDGYGQNSKPAFVRLTGGDDGICTVPFRRSWWHRSEDLPIRGFQALGTSIKNPRLEPPLFRDHPRGSPLKCSRLYMLSTALEGPSTIVFVKHGVVLGGRQEELWVPGSLCVVGLDGLSTDLSRRNVRRDSAYKNLVAEVGQELNRFHNDTRSVLGF